MTPEEAIRDLVLALCPFARPVKEAKKPSKVDYVRARRTMSDVVDAIARFDISVARPSSKRGVQ